MSDAAPGSFPEGWQLGAESWRFHRRFYRHVGRVAACGEYSAIAVQIRFHRAEQLDRHHYRVVLADGTPLVVRGSNYVLFSVEAADWTPKPSKAAAVARPATQGVASASEVVAPPPVEVVTPPAPVVAAPPRRSLGANTLTLGSPAASRALAERLRRMGIPAELAAS